ncbi:Leucine-rich repeat transmembrane neuronal protein 1 [Halotydeus destructor]|nr:Leucine-rich repeat transmembrane neuronal protein 1 [Halotydeus destructor]
MFKFEQFKMTTLSTLVALMLAVTQPGLISGLCPNQCTCNDNLLKATCSSSGLTTVPITLNPRLKELYINENRIREISSNSLNFYRHLEILSLSSNKLSTLGDKLFLSLSKLQLLFLDTNSIVDIPSSSRTFRGLSALLVLSLARNSLSSLGSATFVGLFSLEELDLSSNLIDRLDSSSFAGLTRLKVLSLRDNRLRYIVDSSRLGLDVSGSLIKLDLGVNMFEGQTLELDAFGPMDHLQDLRIDLSGLVGLGFAVDSSRTQSNHHLKSLRSVDLQGNSIAAINGHFDELFTRVKCIDLRRNQLNCNCSLKNFVTSLQNATASKLNSSNSADYDCSETLERLVQHVQCFEPASLKNRTLASVDFEQSVHCVDSFAVELEQNFAFLWLSVLICSAIVTAVLIYIRTSLFEPTYLKSMASDVHLWPKDTSDTSRPICESNVQQSPNGQVRLIQNPFEALHRDSVNTSNSTNRMFAVSRGLCSSRSDGSSSSKPLATNGHRVHQKRTVQL